MGFYFTCLGGESSLSVFFFDDDVLLKKTCLSSRVGASPYLFRTLEMMKEK